jgi:glycerol-3-phosphate dehydrogenase
MNEGQDADLIIIGGGINGVAIAREAALRGLHVHLIEARDLCYGTSAGSTRLIHGGLRYLETLEFGLVRESLRERQLLLQQRPWRVSELELQLTVQDDDPHWVSTLRMGLWLYEAMAGRPFGGEVRSMSSAKLRKKFPTLRPDGLRGGLRYVDAQVRYPERLVVELMSDAAQAGASVDVGVRVEALLRDLGRVVGVELSDGRLLYAPVVVNATGHWVDDLMRRSESRDVPLLHTTRGSHIMLPRPAGHPDSGLYAQARGDGRAFFLIPWGESLWVGTTDIYHDQPNQWWATDEEINYLLREANLLLPKADFKHADIILTRAGIRPLVRAQGPQVKEGEVSRAHKVVRPKDFGGEKGLLLVLGGKLTTHRSLAEETIDCAAKMLNRGQGHKTRSHDALLDELAESERPKSLSPAIFARINRVYGPYARPMLQLMRDESELAEPLVPGLPLAKAEVLHAMTLEWAASLDDLFARRCMLTTEDLPWHGRCMELAQAAGALMHWSDEECLEQHQLWMQAIERHDRFTAAKIAALNSP